MSPRTPSGADRHRGDRPEPRGPWSVVPLSGGRALISERDTATILLLDNGQTTEIVATPGGAAREEGRAWAWRCNHRILTRSRHYTAATDNPGGGVRFRRPAEQRAHHPQGGIPRAHPQRGRIAFGPDGFLYIATGETTNRILAQDPHLLGRQDLADHPKATRRRATRTCIAGVVLRPPQRPRPGLGRGGQVVGHGVRPGRRRRTEPHRTGRHHGLAAVRRPLRHPRHHQPEGHVVADGDVLPERPGDRQRVGLGRCAAWTGVVRSAPRRDPCLRPAKRGSTASTAVCATWWRLRTGSCGWSRTTPTDADSPPAATTGSFRSRCRNGADLSTAGGQDRGDGGGEFDLFPLPVARSLDLDHAVDRQLADHDGRGYTEQFRSLNLTPGDTGDRRRAPRRPSSSSAIASSSAFSNTAASLPVATMARRRGRPRAARSVPCRRGAARRSPPRRDT